MAVEQGRRVAAVRLEDPTKASASTHGANWQKPNRLCGSRFVIAGSMPG